jgi:hypothetical protein
VIKSGGSHGCGQTQVKADSCNIIIKHNVEEAIERGLIYIYIYKYICNIYNMYKYSHNKEYTSHTSFGSHTSPLVYDDEFLISYFF